MSDNNEKSIGKRLAEQALEQIKPDDNIYFKKAKAEDLDVTIRCGTMSGGYK